MKLNEFIDFLNGKRDKNLFLSSIQNEVQEYKSQKQKNTSQIVIQDMEFVCLFEKKQLLFLFECFLNNEITTFELEYLLNALDFSDFDFEPQTREIIYILSTPEIHSPITKEYIIHFMKII